MQPLFTDQHIIITKTVFSKNLISLSNITKKYENVLVVGNLNKDILMKKYYLLRNYLSEIVLNYVSYVPSYPTCLTCLCARVPYVPYVPACLYVFTSYMHFLRALRAFIFYVPYVPSFFYVSYGPSFFHVPSFYLRVFAFLICLHILETKLKKNSKMFQKFEKHLRQ